jgi:hypothetical protein
VSQITRRTFEYDGVTYAASIHPPFEKCCGDHVTSILITNSLRRADNLPAPASVLDAVAQMIREILRDEAVTPE